MIYKLRDWIDTNKIRWSLLSLNPNAIHLLEKNVDKIDWNRLSSNPNAIHLLEKNVDKINWCMLSENPSIFELDYEGLENRCNIYKEELMEKALHPSTIKRCLNHPDLKDKDLEYILDNCL